MDTRDGLIYTEEELKARGELTSAFFHPVTPTKKQMARRPPRVGKYDPCPCGSGKKFKFCCYCGKTERG